MAEATPLTHEPDPQEAIAQLLITVGDGEPTADQLDFLNTEADKIEGGLIVHDIDDSLRTEYRIPQGGYIHARPATYTHHVDDIARHPKPPYGADILSGKNVRPAATAQGVTKFNLEHTYNYVDPDTGDITRLDDTLARTLLEFSTYNRGFQPTTPTAPGTTPPVHVRQRSYNDLPDTGKVHLDEASYGRIREFVDKLPRVSAEYFQQKGLNKREATAVFGRLIADGVVDGRYTPTEGYRVLANVPPQSAERLRRTEKFMNAIRGITVQVEEPEDKREAWDGPMGKLIIDDSSTRSPNPVDITPATPTPEVHKPQPEDYLLTTDYWQKVVRYIAQHGHDSHDPAVGWAPKVPVAGVASKLPRVDREEANKVMEDVFLKLRKDGILQPVYGRGQRGRQVLEEYKLLKSKDEILSFYGVAEEDDTEEQRALKRLYLNSEEIIDDLDKRMKDKIDAYNYTVAPIGHLPVEERLRAKWQIELDKLDIRKRLIAAKLEDDFGGNVPAGLAEALLAKFDDRAVEARRKKATRKKTT